MIKRKPIEELIAEVEHHLVVLDELHLSALEAMLQQLRGQCKQALEALGRLEKRAVESKRVR
jgi:hypothetical protein